MHQQHYCGECGTLLVEGEDPSAHRHPERRCRECREDDSLFRSAEELRLHQLRAHDMYDCPFCSFVVSRWEVVFFFFFFFGVFWGGTQPGVLLTSTTSLCHPPQCSSTVEAHLLKTHRLDLPAVDAVRMVADDFKVRRETYMYTGMRLNSS